MGNDNTNRLRKTYFDQVDTGEGTLLNVPKTRLKSFGAPPWELVIDDQFENVIPDEASELVGAIVWRGIRFERSMA